MAIIGSAKGGGALQIIDALQDSRSLVPVAVFDSDVTMVGKSILGIPVVDSSSEVLNHFEGGSFDCVIIAIGTWRSGRVSINNSNLQACRSLTLLIQARKLELERLEVKATSYWATPILAQRFQLEIIVTLLQTLVKVENTVSRAW